MADADNTTSPEPPCMDIDTPSQIQLWNEDECKILESHWQYHREMLRIIEHLQQNGPPSHAIKMPSKPKGDIKQLISPNKTPATKILTGEELHDYLVKRLITENHPTCPSVSEVDQLNSINEELIGHLKNGYALLKNSKAQCLCISMDYGQWLEAAYQLFAREKIAGKQTGSWRDWLATATGMEESIARKLREAWKLFKNYPKIRRLGLSFSELFQRRKEIEGMLNTRHEIAQFWQTN